MSILVTSEWPYCAYPLVTEVYNFCTHGCLYCFTKHKETWHNKARKRRERGFDPDRDILDIDPFKRVFRGETNSTKTDKLLNTFLSSRSAIQIGSQTDPGGTLERQYRRCLQFLRVLKVEGNAYPVRISTKGTAFGDHRYLDVFDGYSNATILVSAVSMDTKAVKRIEPNAPTVKRRFRMARALSETGVRLGLRLRPVIPGFTEKTLTDLIGEASNAGFQWVTVDWLRIPRTLTAESRDNYEKLSDIVGVDLLDYFRRYSDIAENRNGFLRLKPENTIRLYDRVHSLCTRYGLRLASCNKDFRCYRTYTPNCCGGPLSDRTWNRMQFSYAVHVAKRKGRVHLDDVFDAKSPLNQIINKDNKSKTYWTLTYGETFKKIWNDPTHRYYPANFFPELKFVSKDKAGNHVFAYNSPGTRKNKRSR